MKSPLIETFLSIEFLVREALISVVIWFLRALGVHVAEVRGGGGAGGRGVREGGQGASTAAALLVRRVQAGIHLLAGKPVAASRVGRGEGVTRRA